MNSTAADRRARFRELHERGCFVLPNPWDAGSAKLLARMGFQALATTSAGYAWSQGLPDGEVVTREMVLEHLRVIVAATDLPVNADFESGYAADAEGVARSVRMAIDTGVAGISIEDSTGNADHPLRPIDEAVARLRAARAAIDESASGVILIGRAENFFLGRPDIDDAIARLKAYSEAGADCLYAPGIRTREQIAAVVKAVSPKPVNLLIGWESDLTVQEAQSLGVRRISVGGALARAAWGGFLRAARRIAEDGRFDGFAGMPPGKELNDAFRA